MNISSNISAPFIRRPIGTSLITVAIFLAGVVAYRQLPVAPLPQIDFPVIYVTASYPGASPETMASAIATPLERQFSRIASINEMTSHSSLGSCGIVMQFDLNRDVNAAARDVQAAINAARTQLPANLPSNPTYHKVNPADAPILQLALTSATLLRPDIYDSADSIIDQRLSQVPGVGQVSVSGSAQPAVRVEADPNLMNADGISLEQLRTVLNTANANRPKGELGDSEHSWMLNSTDQLFKAKQYAPLIVGWNNGAAVRVEDVAKVTDGVADRYNFGLANGQPAIIVTIFKQPGANILETVARIRALLPQLEASIPAAIHVAVTNDRTPSIRTSIRDIEFTMMISVVLVVLVVFVFLRDPWATAIPSVAVPLSLMGTFGAMYLLGYTIDNLSLMALTISTGFVVDDAIVMIENIARHVEAGMAPYEAALVGAREMGFTVVSMSASLIAVFLPVMLMGGILGRVFREFGVVLGTAIAVSLFVSLTTTPMMCSVFLRRRRERHGFLYRVFERGFDLLQGGYNRCLRWVLWHQPEILGVTLLTIAGAVYLYIVVPKGFFPQQDIGRIGANIQADQDIGFPALEQKMEDFSRIVLADPAVETATTYAGSGNSAGMQIQLKPLAERKVGAEQVILRIRRKASRIPGATLYMQAFQDIHVGGRSANSQFQYTLQGDTVEQLRQWAPIMMAAILKVPEVYDTNSDLQVRGLETSLQVDRDTAGRMGVSMNEIDDTINDAFGQRQVSTMYEGINQYHVVLEVAPQFQKDPNALREIYVPAQGGNLVPLSAFAHYAPAYTALSVNHQGIFPAITLSFNMRPGASLSDAVRDITMAQRSVGLPASVHATFQGTAKAFQDSLASEPFIIMAALAAVYIVLGVLYESYIHPITILSTLPSAGIGALLAILAFKTDLNVIALIGIILLIGIVKKNAILMIDFALQTERMDGTPPLEAIYAACLLRFRPIMMTTLAALFGALPLAVVTGEGAELRKPLGITIVGGLILSQMLTLFTTPVVYLYLDRLQSRAKRAVSRRPEEALVP